MYNTEDNRSSFGKQEKIQTQVRKRAAIAKGTVDKRTKQNFLMEFNQFEQQFDK